MLPFVVMAVVAAVDVLAGPKIGFIPLLSLGPALAAVALGPARIVLAGGLAIALSLALAAYDGFLGSRQWLIILAAIAGVTATGIAASAARRESERELASVRAVAEVAQKVLLRPVPGGAGHVAFAVRYISAAAAAHIGGDLYEVIVTAENTRLIVADVQGKGLAAVQTASVVLGAFREAAYDAADLPELAARIELSLERQGSDEEFVTAVLAQITNGGGIEILSCGHPPPLLLSGTAVRFAEPPEIGVPLGLSWLAVSPRKSGAFRGSCTVTTDTGKGEDGVPAASGEHGRDRHVQRLRRERRRHGTSVTTSAVADTLTSTWPRRRSASSRRPAGRWPPGRARAVRRRTAGAMLGCARLPHADPAPRAGRGSAGPGDAASAGAAAAR